MREDDAVFQRMGKNTRGTLHGILCVLLWNKFLFQTIANHLRAFDIVAAQQMKLLLPPHFSYSTAVFPPWPDMKSITHPPTAEVDEWPPLAVGLCCQMVSPISLSSFLLLSLAINRRTRRGRTELCLTYPSSQRSSSTTAKVKEPQHSWLSRWGRFCTLCAVTFLFFFF